MKRWLLAAAALLGVTLASGEASAGDLVPGLRIQTGFTLLRTPQTKTDDLFVAATPELNYFFGSGRTTFVATYQFTGSLNTALPSSIANRVALSMSHDLSDRTRLLLGVDALQSTIGNFLLVRRTTDTQIGGIPSLNTQLVTLTANQGIQHDITPQFRFTETLSTSYATSGLIDPSPAVRLDNYLTNLILGLDRGWQFDRVGVDLRGQFARSIIPPLRATIFTVGLGPRWVHDVNRWMTTTLSAQGAVAFSPDANTKPRLSPAGRAAALFFDSEGSGIEASYTGGFEPNLLVGTLLQSHLVQVRGYTPISMEKRIILSVAAGYQNARNVDLRTTGANDNQFDAVLHDLDITWGATEWLQLFARYQFVGQSSGDGPRPTPAIVRHAAILGLQIAPRTPNRRPDSQFPQRVDEKDKDSGGDSGGSSGSDSKSRK